MYFYKCKSKDSLEAKKLIRIGEKNLRNLFYVVVDTLEKNVSC